MLGSKGPVTGANFAVIADALRKTFPNNRIHVNSNKRTIRVMIETEVVEIFVRRVN